MKLNRNLILALAVTSSVATAGSAFADEATTTTPGGDQSTTTVSAPGQGSGGVTFGAPSTGTGKLSPKCKTTSAAKAKIKRNGKVLIPKSAPEIVKRILCAGNELVGTSYVYGGGHGNVTALSKISKRVGKISVRMVRATSVDDRKKLRAQLVKELRQGGLDCSGAISGALILSNIDQEGKMIDEPILTSPLDSSSFMSWGSEGYGQYFTVLTNPDHAYLELKSVGVRLDTSGRSKQVGGLVWQTVKDSNAGYEARHADADPGV